jgi:hypothetical protein
MIHKIEFVSYDGEYPCLCNGKLTIKVDGKEYRLDNVLISGGSVTCDDDYNFQVFEDEWTIDKDALPEELKNLSEQICQVVNEHVDYGCCGGCI